MKKLLLAVVVSMAITSIPALAQNQNQNQNQTNDSMQQESYQNQNQTNDSMQQESYQNQNQNQSNDSMQQDTYQYQQAQGAVAPDTSIDLSDAEVEDLKYMREEEKLARDVYLKLYDIWDEQIFKRIANAEQQHMNSVETLLIAYEIPDPALAEQGEFSNDVLQILYDTLIIQGSESLTAALQVGLKIEEIDILDLLEAMTKTSNSAITLVYIKLLNGSYSHLRAFVRQLESEGEEYVPELLSVEEAESILDGKQIAAKTSAGAAVDENLNPLQTQSRFEHKVSTGSGKAGNGIEFDQDDPVRIASRFIPEDKDVGETAECLLVGQYETEEGQKATFMRNSNGWVIWEGNVNALTGEQCKLTAEYELKVFEGPLTGAPGRFTFFPGYRLKNGKMVYSTESLTFRVN